MAAVTREMLTAERAVLVAQRDEAARRASAADGAIQLADALLAHLAPTPDAKADRVRGLLSGIHSTHGHAGALATCADPLCLDGLRILEILGRPA